MKQLSAIIFCVLATSLSSCKKCTVAGDIPACIKNNIENNRDKENWYVASVEEYRFQNKLVYAFNPDHKIIADGATFVISLQCDTLCTVGGFGGPDILLCNGDNFSQKAVLVRKVWSKY